MKKSGMPHRMVAPGLALAAVIGVTLVGCSGPAPVPEVITQTSAPAAATPTASPVPTAVGEAGTRSHPLAVGQSRLLVDKSMWTVGASAATEIGDGYIVLPVRLDMDWDASQAQIDASGQGGDVADIGVEPQGSLTFQFVAADGTSYSSFDQYDVDIPELFTRVGTVYPPLATLNVNVPISVPAEQVAGGVWRVQNFRGDSVFLSTQ